VPTIGSFQQRWLIINFFLKGHRSGSLADSLPEVGLPMKQQNLEDICMWKERGFYLHRTKLVMPHRYVDILTRYPSTEELTLLSCVGEVVVQISAGTLTIVYFLIPWCRTSANIWPIVPAPDDNWQNENWQEKPKYSEKACSSAALSTTNPTWCDLGSKLGRRGSRELTTWPMLRPTDDR
jgi:hypothetical protein